jgi:hypothetical protein
MPAAVSNQDTRERSQLPPKITHRDAADVDQLLNGPPGHQHTGHRQAAGKGTFPRRLHRVLTCESTGTPVQHDADVWVNFNFNQRGSSPFPYDRESAHGTDVFTNLDIGGTFTNVFSLNTKDHVITDNGDGTITILVIATGGSRYYDTDGNLVLNDPGQIRFSFDVDYNGTPSDPTDDVEIPNSFQVVRDSTGRNDTAGRDFCADLVEFTS